MTIDAVLTGAATLTGAGAGRRAFGLGRGLGLGATTTGTLSVAGDSAGVETADALSADGLWACRRSTDCVPAAIATNSTSAPSQDSALRAFEKGRKETFDLMAGR